MNKRTLKIYVFYCSNSIEQNQLAGACSGSDGITIKTIGLPCSGKIDIPYLVKAFETGADGAVIVTCKQNECRHLEGNLRAQKRAEAVESLLEEIGMGKGRMAVTMLGEDGIEQVLAEIRNFFGRVGNLPQQPVVSLPALSAHVLSAIEGVEGSNPQAQSNAVNV